MENTIYYNNEVRVTIERESQDESTVRMNGDSLIWISNETKDNFAKELNELLDKYRI